ncbi:hypothetical protein GCM10028819_46210 [Spirosoma humi]
MDSFPESELPRRDFKGIPDFPANTTSEEIVTRLVTMELKGKPGLKLVHNATLRNGSKVLKIATLFVIVHHDTGEFKGYDLIIHTVVKRKVGFYVDFEKRFSINDTQGEIRALYDFLELIYREMLPDHPGEIYIIRSEDDSKDNSREGISEQSVIDAAQALNELSITGRETFLNALRSQHLTKEDINILTGRKQALDEFKTQLQKEATWDEKEWQAFFERNTWIFGYGLDYRFLSILQREASVSTTTIAGKESVTADFLLSDKNFTVLVELKKPETNLFNTSQNRSGSWSLSKDLIEAVSQILEQKAEWQIKSRNAVSMFNKSGARILQRTVDPKAILIIGCSSQIKGTDLEKEIKLETFELFRRSQRNIEIVMYDELYERAKFIVSHEIDSNT